MSPILNSAVRHVYDGRDDISEIRELKTVLVLLDEMFERDYRTTWLTVRAAPPAGYEKGRVT